MSGKRWSGTLATQTVHFRGTSTVNILSTATAAPQFRNIQSAVYSLLVAGGVSGSFGAHILGWVGNTTFVVAGLTAISTAGNRIMAPVGYSSTGSQELLGVIKPSFTDLLAIDQKVVPVQVVFQSGVATAGISASCTVGAVLWGEE